MNIVAYEHISSLDKAKLNLSICIKPISVIR